ncbi:excalibur calcium-binding domain-containing protein [Streptomyces sp. NPDC057620]
MRCGTGCWRGTGVPRRPRLRTAHLDRDGDGVACEPYFGP